MSHDVWGFFKRIGARVVRSTSPTLEGIDFVVLGLGNPGSEYLDTRHNVGSNVVRRFARERNSRLRRIGRLVRVARIELNGSGIDGQTETISVLAGIPTTFMNESGSAAAWLLERCGVSPECLMVVHDDLDLPLGTVRFKFGGGSGGHRGVESVIKALGTYSFQRLRIGIGRPPAGEEPVDYVLGPFAPEERDLADQSSARAAEAIEYALIHGIDAAMNLYNSGADAESGVPG